MTNTTIELINYAVDVQAEQNMKIIFLLVISCYTILALWYFSNNEPSLYIFYIIKRLNQAFAFVWFFFLPIYIGSLYRTVPFEFFYFPLLGFYGILISIAPLLFLFGYGEKILIWFWGFFNKSDWVRFRRNNK